MKAKKPPRSQKPDTLEAEVHRLRAQLKQRRAKHLTTQKLLALAAKERSAAVRERDEARAERDALKKAKAENDERFMTERDAARERVAELDLALHRLLAAYRDLRAAPYSHGACASCDAIIAETSAALAEATPRGPREP